MFGDKAGDIKAKLKAEMPTRLGRLAPSDDDGADGERRAGCGACGANPEIQIIRRRYGGDEITKRAKAIATEAFARYDTDGNGTIDKEGLFDMCLTVGQVAPAGAMDPEKREYLEKQWALADTNGDGTVDYDEFVEFYVRSRRYAAEERRGTRSTGTTSTATTPWRSTSLPGALRARHARSRHPRSASTSRSSSSSPTRMATASSTSRSSSPSATALHDSRKSDLIFERRRKGKRARGAEEARARVRADGADLRRVPQVGTRVALGQVAARARGLQARGQGAPRRPNRAGRCPTAPRRRRSRRASSSNVVPGGVHHVRGPGGVAQGLCGHLRGGRRGVHRVGGAGAADRIGLSRRREPPPEADRARSAQPRAADAVHQSWGFDDVGVFIDWSCMYQRCRARRRPSSGRPSRRGSSTPRRSI